MNDNREEFEAWASDQGRFDAVVKRNGEGYLLSVTQTYWQAWKARGESDEFKKTREALDAAMEDCSLSMAPDVMDLCRSALNP